MSETRKCVVTGGAGFIGSHLTERLARDGHEVHAVDDLSTGRRENLDDLDVDGNMIYFYQNDIRNIERLNILEEVDVIFHLAALPSVARSVEQPERITDVNVMGTLSILEAAANRGVPRVVFSSSSSVYGNTEELPKHEDMPIHPESPYAASKAAGEHYCRAYDALGKVETVCLRYFNVFGPRQNPDSDYAAVVPKFIDQRIRDKEAYPVNGDGQQSRDFTYVGNVVEANLLAAGTPYEDLRSHVYNVGCGERHTLEDLMDAIEEAHDGPEPPLEREYGPEREGDVRHSEADITRIQENMGYKPRDDFESGILYTTNHMESILHGWR